MLESVAWSPVFDSIWTVVELQFGFSVHPHCEYGIVSAAANHNPGLRLSYRLSTPRPGLFNQPDLLSAA